MLVHSGNATTVAVSALSTYTDNPTVAPVNGVTFADFSITNASPDDQAVLTFTYTGTLSNPQIFFFDPAAGHWRPFSGTVTNNLATKTITVVFGKFSTPSVTKLTNTLFPLSLTDTRTTTT